MFATSQRLPALSTLGCLLEHLESVFFSSSSVMSNVECMRRASEWNVSHSSQSFWGRQPKQSSCLEFVARMFLSRWREREEEFLDLFED